MRDPAERHGPPRERFRGVAAKRLSLVEVHPEASNQHEINGVAALKRILGEARREKAPTRFVYVDDASPDPVIEDSWVTWYDAREAHPTRSEHRLYFPRNSPLDRAEEGDLLVVAVRSDGSPLVVVAREGSSAEAQVRWLFGIDPGPDGSFDVAAVTESGRPGLAAARILAAIGDDPADEEPALDALVAPFGNDFPDTAAFSTFARSTLEEVDSRDDPDAALVRWMEREEALFRALERRIVEARLNRGFAGDVDGFVRFSLSVHNRRKARTGQALEHHLEAIFQANAIRYTRGARTQEGTRPDFVFPSIESYRDQTFPTARLTMLGAKSTCKERWRQVLSEAKRIAHKHLCTLEPAITTSQLDEMDAQRLSLVVPRELHATFAERDRARLLSLRDFVAVVASRELRAREQPG
jgi:hypothetical protein